MEKVRNIIFLFKESFKVNKQKYLIMFFKNIFRVLMTFLRIIGLGLVINALESGKDIKTIIKLIVIYVSANLLVIVFKEIFELIENNFDRKISDIMQLDYLKDSTLIDYHYIQNRTILNLRRKSQLAHPAGNFLYYIGEFIFYIIQFIGIIYIFSILSPLFIIILMFTSLLSIIFIFRTKQNEYNFVNEKIEEERKLEYLHTVMTNYEYAKEVRINNVKTYIINKYNDIFNSQKNKLKRLFGKSLIINTMGTIISTIQTVIMYIYFSVQVFNKNISIAEYTVLLTTTTLLLSILLEFFDTVASLTNISKSTNFYLEYKDLVNSNCIISESNKLRNLDIDVSNPTINFENVSFIYPGTEKVVLKNINLKLYKGCKIGLVGLNGSGKTTLAKLLTRIYDPSEGVITLNGINIKEIPYKQYISIIGVLLQDFTLFAFSVKENIVLNNDYNEELLISSLIKGGLKDKVFSLKKDINTSLYKILDEEGVELSQGEGQKLALSRAIYRKPEVLVLDEPTSVLDPIAEYDFFSRIKDLSSTKATLFITHRLSSAKLCNKIIVLSDGIIAEEGKHEELMSLGGIYADLFTLQANYYKNKGIPYNE